MDRVTVPEAARILGIKEESVRKRVSRGTLRADKDEDGRLLVWVDGTRTVRDESTDESVTDEEEVRDEMVENLREQVSYLRSQLDVRAEEIQRRDIIISQLTQATSNLTDRLRELEPAASPSAPSQPSEESAQDAADGVAGPRPPAGGGEAQTASHKPWWRRVFGR